ncbi:MAG: hypothetical protein ACT4QF_17945 [Sporichthyaceae bacterium]
MKRVAGAVAALGVSWVLAGCGSLTPPLAAELRPSAPAEPPGELAVQTPAAPVTSRADVPERHVEAVEVATASPSAAPPRPSPRPTEARIVVEAPPQRVSVPSASTRPSAKATARATRTPLPTRKPAPDLVRTRPGMTNIQSVPWERAEVRGPQRLRVHFVSGVSPCRFLDSVRVDYRPTAVVVTLYVGSDPKRADRVCAAVARDRAVDVSLAKPLDGRAILDGAKTLAPAIPRAPGSGAVEVHPKPGATATRTTSWTRAEATGPRTIRVFYNSGTAPCSVLDRVNVAYAADRVTVTLVVGRDRAAAGQACAMALRPVYVDVRLAEPLAGRRIVDGA